MNTKQIIERCISHLGMTIEDARWVSDHLYEYCMPDFSEWDWPEIDQAFRDVLWFKDKTKAEIEAALCVS